METKAVRAFCEKEGAPLSGMAHQIKDMAGFGFLMLRTGLGLTQCVLNKEQLQGVTEGCALRVYGERVEDERAPGGYELRASRVEVLSRPSSPLPPQIGKYNLGMALENELGIRPVSLRNLKKRAVFKVQEGIVRGFRDYLLAQGFTEIHSPKLGLSGAEGGANMFRLPYFGDTVAVLAQSPQFYKQIMVGVFGRVFEVGPVFRAEKHATARHLNEYTSLDFEMGFIDSEKDVMAMETGMLQAVVELLQAEYAPQLKLLRAELPRIDEIPYIEFTQAKEAVAARFNRRIRDPYDLEPEEEQLISRMVLEETGSRFCFVTRYPSKKRPFYAMDDWDDAKYTRSFDLLFDGLEITTGGQRVHEYGQQVQKLLDRGMNPAEFEDFLMIHKYGMPPHGGLGIGLERLTMKFLGLQNIREASLFPRDINRLRP
jgi:nondiscriminating aspartyl-tRNA synthetase